MRALARRGEGGKITLLTKPLAGTKKWLAHDPCVEEILYFDKSSLLREGLRLRKKGFDEAWILHRSLSHTLLTVFAGIPVRIGPGFDAQRFLTSNKPLPPRTKKEHHLEQMDALMAWQNIEISPQDKMFLVEKDAHDFIEKTYAHLPRPWLTLGIGASVPQRVWPLERFAQLAHALKENKIGTFFVCGSPQEAPQCGELTRQINAQGANAVCVANLPLPQIFALLKQADLFIGNDSGLLNASAATGVKSVGLFGMSPVLKHSPYIYGATVKKSHTPTMSNLQVDDVLDICTRYNLHSFSIPLPLGMKK
jgi:heptosyltransferase II